MTEPAALAHVSIHETVERILSTIPPGRLLDVPAGEGALAVRALRLGFKVECADLYPNLFKLDQTICQRADLDAQLPYEDEAFAVVTCVEGLEHIEHPANAMREFARVLKPGGILVVSVPNIMNIEERLKWLFNGYTSHFKPISTEVRERTSAEFPGMAEVALHVNPIGYSEVRYLLESSGFVLERTHFDKPKGLLWLYLPLVLLIRAAARFTPARKRRERWTDELNSAEVLTGGNTLIFEARKL